MLFMSNDAFILSGPATPESPVILSVPHAGRDYPADLEHHLCTPLHRLINLEDRRADALISSAVSNGKSAITARAPRLMIDLNRHEYDVDPDMFDGPVRHHHRLSAKARGGLGLIPRRTAAAGDIWREKLSSIDLDYRVNRIHTPYHDALAKMLGQARATFGVAILLDIHSMPPLPETQSGGAPDIVIGDMFGRSACNSFTEIAAKAARRFGLRVAVNAPYPGNYILDRHSKPASGIHALQIEVDRRLYLCDDLINLSAGLPRVQNVIDAVADECAALARQSQYAIAAE